VGSFLVILSALSYSSLGIFGKIGLQAGLPLTSFLATRFLLAAAVLWGFGLGLPRLRRAHAAAARRRPRLLLWGMVGLSGQSALYFAGLRVLSASLMEVLLYTCPAFLALIEWGRTGHRPRPRVLTALGLALFGVWLASAPALTGTTLPGVVLGLLTGLWYASFLVPLDRITEGIEPVVATTWIVSGAALVWTCAALWEGIALPSGGATWQAIAGIVIFPTILGFALFVAGMRRTGPQIASILSTFEPVGTLLLAALVLDERLLARQWSGAILVVAAAVLLALEPGRRAAAPPEADLLAPDHVGAEVPPTVPH
jgi:drug/metabolite transporter (DMT)-like permease